MKTRLETMDQTQYVPYLGTPRPCVVCGSNFKREWARDGIFVAVECNVCHLVWMDPFLSPEGLSKYYDNYIQYRLDNPIKMLQRDRMYELDAGFLQQFVKKGALLDVGCSAGYFLEKLNDEFEKNGIEFDSKAVEEAQQRGFLKDRIKIGRLGEDDFRAASFDVVVMRGVVEHLPEPDQSIARVAELLKPGGYFYITATPNVESFCADIYREKWNLWDPYQHIYHFSVPTLMRLCKRFGLELVAEAYPYVETPYANPPADHEQVLADYERIRAGRRDEVGKSPAFWGNMLTVLFQKKAPRRASAFTRHSALRKYNQPGKCYVIAEAGLNHNGSLTTAKKLIDVAATAGVDAVKFQKRTVETLAIGSVLDAPDDRFPEFGSTYRQIREHIEFGWNEYVELKAYTEHRGLDFLCTPFDIEAADFLLRLGAEAFKVASHNLTNLPLLRHLAATSKPTILSTGMCEQEDIDAAVAIYEEHLAPLVLLHCVSAYPTPPDQCNLAMMGALRERYGLPVGYSGHELGYIPTLASVAMGATVIERHFTLDKTMPGFDHKMSLEPDELIAMVRNIHLINAAHGHTQKHVTETERITLNKYHVSAVSREAIPAGTTITSEMITYKNPGTGIPPKDVHQLIGKVANQYIPADTLFRLDMVQ